MDRSNNEKNPLGLITGDSMALNQHWLEKIGPALFPASCIFSVQRYDTPDIALPPPDDAALQNAVEKRRREFSAGRSAARAALLKLGLTETRVPVGPERNPLWPTGIVGSITHTAGLAIAVVARTQHVLAVGLDLELSDAVKPQLWKAILGAREIDYVSAKPPDEQTRAATLIFSAKESFYKMQYPLTRQWVDFQEAEVTVFEPTGTFELVCRQTLATDQLHCARFSGRYVIGPEFTLTAMYLAG